MPYQTIPGSKVQYRPLSETLADPNFDVYTDPDGTMAVRKKAGFWTKAIPYLVGGGMGYGALANAGVFGAAAAGAGGSGAGAGAATSVIPGTGIPVVAGTGPGLTAPALAGTVGSAASGAAGRATQAAAPSVARSLTQQLTDPQNLAGLAALIPMLTNMGGGDDSNNPFGNSKVNEEIASALALQRKRLEQTQPALDTLVNMAYGMSPTRYRGAAPEGYTPNEAPTGPYQYESPRFGGNG